MTEWEAEQERIKAEEAMNALHAEALAMNEEFDRQLAARIESDHEMALLMNDAFDREQAEKKAEEQASREADVKYRKAVGVEVVKALMANTSLTRDQAIEVLTAVKDGRIPHAGISY